MTHCYLALGGNTGDVARAFERALERIAGTLGCTITARSTNYDTTPVGAQAGDRYLNAAVALETALEPLALLDLLQSIEAALGRVRTIHWGPRPLDLDLVFYGSEIVHVPRLIVPHPAAWYRRFVLDPLVEIAPQFVHPIKQATVSELRDRLLARPFPVALAGGTNSLKESLAAEVSATFSAVRIGDWEQAETRRAEPAIVFWLGGPARDFEVLPLISRLDVTTLQGTPREALQFVLQTALG